MLIQLLSIIIPLGAISYIVLSPVKKDKEQSLTSLRKISKGDDVVMISGLHGVVDEVDSNKNIVTIDCEGVFFDFDLYAVKNVVSLADKAGA